jgi:hypothetical protein
MAGPVQPEQVADRMNAAAPVRNEYVLTDQAPPDCAVCSREAMIFPVVQAATTQEANFIDQEATGEENILQFPVGSEVFPKADPGARASLEGILDTLATRYPEEAGVLLAMCAPESEQIGAGFEIEYVTSERRKALKAELRQLRHEIEVLSEQSMTSLINARRQTDPEQVRILENQGFAARDANIPNYRRKNELEHLLGSLTYWHIDPVAKKFVITDTINYNVDRPFLELDEVFTGDDDVTEDPTNAEAAAWLAKVIEYNLDPEKEFVREKWRRRTAGTALVAFGAVECVIGAGLIASGGLTAGLSTAGGLLVTTVGVNSIEQGWRMLHNPDPTLQITYLDGLVGDLGEAIGGAEGKRDAQNMWSLFQLGVGLGGAFAPVRITLNGAASATVTGMRRLAGALPERGAFHLLQMPNIAALKGGGRVLMQHLPSGRGILTTFATGQKMVISAGDNLLRIMVQMRFALPERLLRRIAFLKVDADPVRKLIGRATDTHPAEVEAMKQAIKDAGGVVADRPGAMSYSPLREGQPGVISIDPNASYSAWLHEYQHFVDDMASNWQGYNFLHKQQHVHRWAWESRAYQKEIDFVRGLRDVPRAQRDNVIQDLERLMAREHADIFSTRALSPRRARQRDHQIERQRARYGKEESTQ